MDVLILKIALIQNVQLDVPFVINLYYVLFAIMDTFFFSNNAFNGKKILIN